MARIITCAACGKQRPHKAHGRCNTCHARWLSQGKPEGGPRPPMTSAERIRRRTRWVPIGRAAATARREDYKELRAMGLTVAEAAERVGVTVRTAYNYEAARREQVSS